MTIQIIQKKKKQDDDQNQEENNNADDDEFNPTLAAMETEIKPKVITNSSFIN